MKQTAYLVQSGDKSSWFWKYWLFYWKKFWNLHDTIDTVFLGETTSIAHPGILTEKTGSVPWGQGMIECLKRLPHKYIILSHEDYCLDENPFPELLNNLLAACEQHNIQLLKCCGWWAGDPDWHQDGAFASTDIMIKGIDGKETPLWLYNQTHMYLISHQCSIWNREFMISCIKQEWSPWEHELTGTDDLRNRNVKIYCYREKCPIPYGEVLQHNAVRDGMQHVIENADREGLPGVDIV